MDNQIHCPKCNSTQITANKKGFSGGKAVAGALLTGGVGLLAGTIGSNKVIITCLACGHHFKPGEGSKTISQPQSANVNSKPLTFSQIAKLLEEQKKTINAAKQKNSNSSKNSRSKYIFGIVLFSFVLLFSLIITIAGLATKEWGLFSIWLFFSVFSILLIRLFAQKMKTITKQNI